MSCILQNAYCSGLQHAFSGGQYLMKSCGQWSNDCKVTQISLVSVRLLLYY